MSKISEVEFEMAIVKDNFGLEQRHIRYQIVDLCDTIISLKKDTGLDKEYDFEELFNSSDIHEIDEDNHNVLALMSNEDNVKYKEMVKEWENL